MNKPFGIMMSPRAQTISPSDQEMLTDQEELKRAQARAAEKALRNRDEIGELIGATYHIQNKTFPLVVYQGYPMCVSRWYPERSAAVDVFESIGRAERAEITFKREWFKSMNLRYAALSWASELAELLPQLGLKG